MSNEESCRVIDAIELYLKLTYVGQVLGYS